MSWFYYINFLKDLVFTIVVETQFHVNKVLLNYFMCLEGLSKM
jgi:hypothetical protein